VNRNMHAQTDYFNRVAVLPDDELEPPTTPIPTPCMTRPYVDAARRSGRARHAR
jgi:hypothetical protein